MQFIAARRTSFNWLHAAGIYDILLIFFGIPTAIYFSERVGGHFESFYIHKIIKVSIYIYSFLLALNVLRVLFSYSRWVFPKVEMDSDVSSPLRHRLVWTAILLSVCAAFIYDAIKYLFQ